MDVALGWLMELFPLNPETTPFGMDPQSYADLRYTLQAMNGSANHDWPLEDPTWDHYVYPVPVK